MGKSMNTKWFGYTYHHHAVKPSTIQYAIFDNDKERLYDLKRLLYILSTPHYRDTEYCLYLVERRKSSARTFKVLFKVVL